MKRGGRYLGWALTLAGVGIIVYYVNKLGLDSLVSALRSMGWGLAVLLALPIFLTFTHAWAWSYTLSQENRRRIGLPRLTLLHTIGNGIMGVQPFQSAVSEPLKLLFVRHGGYDRRDFTASLIIDNTINAMSIVFFGAAGLVYLLLAFDVGVIGAVTIGGVLGFMVLMVLLLLVVQRRGIFTGVLGLLGKLRLFPRFCAAQRERAIEIDGRIREYYVRDRRGFFLALLLHTIEKLHGVAEFYVIFHFLDMRVSLGHCFFIAAVAGTLDNLLFFAQFGGMEIYVSTTLSLLKINTASVNIVAALFRRIRILFWAVVALALIYPTRTLFWRRAD